MFPKLDPILHSELRLAVMSILIGVDEADFTYLKKQTGATSGNLSVQIDKLMAAGYITVEKGFKGKMPHTTCKITTTGQEAFNKYVESLKEYLSANKYSKNEKDSQNRFMECVCVSYRSKRKGTSRPA